MKLLRNAALGLLATYLVHPGNGLADVLITDVINKPGLATKPPLATLAEFANGSLIDLPGGVQFVAIDLGTGKEYLASGPGQFRISSNGVQSVTTGSVKVRTVVDAPLPPVTIATGKVSRASMTMRGGAAMLEKNDRMYPSSTAVPTVTPTLRWERVPGSSSYRVTLTEGTKVMWQRATTESQLELTADAGLRGGGQYHWKVEPLQPTGDPLGNAVAASFSVVASDVAQLLATIKPRPDSPFSAWALYAAQLQQAGAIGDAQPIWQALARERPDDPNLQKLVK